MVDLRKAELDQTTKCEFGSLIQRVGRRGTPEFLYLWMTPKISVPKMSLSTRKENLILNFGPKSNRKQTNKPHFSSDSVSNVTFQVTLKFFSLFCAWFGDSRSFKFASCFGSPFYMWTIWYDTDSFINRFIRGKHEPSSPATCPCLYPGSGFVPVILILQQSLARVCGVKDFQIPPYGYLCIWVYGPFFFLFMTLTSRHSCLFGFLQHVHEFLSCFADDVNLVYFLSRLWQWV